MDAHVDTLAAAFEAAAGRSLVVVTGAGISLASGIPTFRGSDEGAVWKHDVTELGTYRFFRHNPVESWLWAQRIFAGLAGAQPNAAHFALAELEKLHLERSGARAGKFLLITQNIDTLHEQAGSQNLVKVHGSADRYRCASPLGCVNGAPEGTIAAAGVDLEPFLAAPNEATLPRCAICGDYLRRHVLWFDEYYHEHEDYQWPRVLDAAQTMDGLLFVGTSFAVGVTELYLRAAVQRRIPIFSIDPAGLQPDRHVEVLKARAEELLPAVVERLRG
jgi:NAD-dependent deacetylase